MLATVPPPSTTLSNTLAANPQSLNSLHLLARQDNGKAAIKASAQQFEAFFLQMMLKSMRATLSEDSPFDSQETRTFTEMSDQQLTQNISRSKGVGLADMLVKQLALTNDPNAIHPQPRPYNLPALTATTPVQDVQPQSGFSATSSDKSGNAVSTPRSFIDRMWPHAAAASKELGVAPHLLLGQAALESGWGKQVPRLQNGTSSHNLFNIKAGSSWNGKVAQVESMEYVGGVAQKRVESFRAYSSDAAAFADYARLLKDNPRYSGVASSDSDAEFARGLQSSGYATDPAYGDKLLRLLGSASFRAALQPEQSSSIQG